MSGKISVKKRGTVYLVGAGPGDPGLITVKGIACLRRADVVVYDRLANRRLLQYVPASCEKICVGKRGLHPLLNRKTIDRLLISRAKRGKVVVRLKGGDPFIFGRGGEEAEALTKAGVPFVVVPGVTSAIAAPTYAGIPLTHRNFASAVAIVAGHKREKHSELTPDWDALSKISTLVFLMGVENLSEIVKKLIQAGRDPKTSVAIVEQGTLPVQRVIHGTLQTIVGIAEKQVLKPPAVIVVGKVTALGKRLRWFEEKALFGKKILVTRAGRQAGALSQLLEEEGAEAIEVPAIEVRPPTNWKSLDRAIQSIGKYQWIVFTSVNGVEFFFRRMAEKGCDIRNLKGIRVAAIGPATAHAIEEKGIRVNRVGKEFRAEGLIEAMKKEGIQGKWILFPRARDGRELLVEALKSMKGRVDLVEAYRTVRPQWKDREKELGKIDLVTFASSSAVENFFKMAPLLRKIPAACIGPITAATAKKYGFNVVTQPKESTIPALVKAIVAYFKKS